MKKIFLSLSILLFLFLNISFAQQNDIPVPKQRPLDFEYLSAPDSIGNRSLLKMPLREKTTQILKLPYPIIFIHGLNSKSDTWDITTNWMDSQYGTTYGGRFDYCLNYDCDNYTANNNFYPTTNADIAVFTGTWIDGDYYYVNFDVGSNGSFHPNGSSYDVLSNQSAIAKQGMALRDAIYRVLQITGRKKVILMGHSMGGLASREYLQNSSIWQPDGYSHIAKLATTGTPHGGSNANTGGSLLSGVDCSGEAYRDLRTTYSGSGSNGVYLFGGLESSSVMDLSLCSGFYNYDVNCNGTIGNYITGLNYKNIDTATIDYSCIIGECTTCLLGAELPGDGIVNDFKANINNYCPNCSTLTSVTNNLFYYTNSATIEIHTDLPSQYYQIMQGLDEPNEYNLSYLIDFDTSYIGFTTMQPVGGYNYDYDDYKFTVPFNCNVTVSITNISLADLMVHIVDLSGNTIGTIHHSSGNSSINFTQALTTNNYYLEIYGTPTTTSYLAPYHFILHKNSASQINELSESLNNIKIYPNPFSTQTIVNFSKEQKNTSVKIIDELGKEIKSFNFKGNNLIIEKGEIQSGLYILQFTDEKKYTVNKKIIIN